MARQSKSEAFKKREREKRKPKPVPKPKLKPQPKARSGLSDYPGKKGLISGGAKIVRGLRSRRNSKLYTMPAKEFRAWFKEKHKFEYPYRVPRAWKP